MKNKAAIPLALCLVFAMYFSSCRQDDILTEIHVPSDFTTIQSAIDTAANGQVIIVDNGIYTGQGNRDIDFKGKAITVRSKNGPLWTIIDCQGDITNKRRGFYFHSGENEYSEVNGFSIINGYGPLATFTIDGSVMSSGGGAIYCENTSSPTIRNCIIRSNTADSGGGGIYCWDHSAPNIINNIIRDNTSGEGGGILFYYGCSAILSSNIICNNTAWSGAGLSISFASNVIMTNNLIVKNSASAVGGAILSDNSYPIIINNTITANTASNTGCAIKLWYDYPTIINSIIWGNTGGDGNEFSSEYSTITMTYSDASGTWLGEGMMDIYPQFIDVLNDDFGLQDTSPLIHSGVITEDVPAFDIIGNSRPRPINTSPDIGAYENIN
jgi:parallel beta-helix repeat protein